MNEIQLDLMAQIEALGRRIETAKGRLVEAKYHETRRELHELHLDLRDVLERFKPRHCIRCNKIRGPHLCG